MSDWFGTISLTLKDNISQVANTAAASFSESDSPVFDRFQVGDLKKLGNNAKTLSLVYVCSSQTEVCLWSIITTKC